MAQETTEERSPLGAGKRATPEPNSSDGLARGAGDKLLIPQTEGGFMEWILVLVIAFEGGGLAPMEIPGHKSKQACLATLENAKKEAENHFGASPERTREMFRRSFCIEKGK